MPVEAMNLHWRPLVAVPRLQDYTAQVRPRVDGSRMSPRGQDLQPPWLLPRAGHTFEHAPRRLWSLRAHRSSPYCPSQPKVDA